MTKNVLGPVYHFNVVECNSTLHPQVIMKELGIEQGFTVVAACSHSIGACWFFETSKEIIDPPPFITKRNVPDHKVLSRMFSNLYGDV